jgi:PAS domain S-box-containing protein
MTLGDLLASAPVGLLTIDAADRVVAANERAGQIFGASRPDLVGQPVTDLLFLPDGRPPTKDGRVAATARRLDGGELPVEVIVARTGRASSPYAAWIRELPRSRETEALAARREALLEAAEQVAQIGSWELLASGELTWSENLYRLYGYEPGEVEPTPHVVFDLTDPSDRARVERAVETLLTDPHAFQTFEYRIRLPDRGLRYLRATLAVVEEQHGRPWRTVGSVFDVTDQRRAERELAAHVAVSGTLAEWSSLSEGGTLLLRNLAEALESSVGVLWLPRGETLVAGPFWHSQVVDAQQFESATRQRGIGAGAGLSGRVWATKEPINVVSIAHDPTYDRREAALGSGLRGAIAFPALCAEEVLAVLEFLSPEHSHPPDRLLRSLTGIGYEIGQFLATRRGELSPPPLTPRELEVLQLAARGNTGREVAAELTISRATVKTHFENIYDKLQVSDRASAVAAALRLGVIQ